jgi:hypothetical protein
MGASAYVSIITGPTLEDAYDVTVTQARYEHGSGGYSGTIAESTGVFLADRTPKLAWDAEQAAAHLINSNLVSKWGAAGAIPVVEPATRRDVKVTIDVAGLDYDEQRAALAAAVRAKTKPGEGVYAVSQPKQGPTQAKTVAAAPKTPTVRRFVVKNGNQTVATCTTQAEARAEAVRILEAGKAWGNQLTVTGETVREGGEPLVTVTRTVVKNKLTYTVTLATPSSTPVTQWAVAGVYSS